MLIYVSLQFFRMAKKSTIDRNINYHHTLPYLQLGTHTLKTAMHYIPTDTVYIFV